MYNNTRNVKILDEADDDTLQPEDVTDACILPIMSSSKIPKADTEDNKKDEDSVPEHVDIPDDEEDLEIEDPDEEDDEEDERLHDTEHSAPEPTEEEMNCRVDENDSKL